MNDKNSNNPKIDKLSSSTPEDQEHPDSLIEAIARGCDVLERMSREEREKLVDLAISPESPREIQ